MTSCGVGSELEVNYDWLSQHASQTLGESAVDSGPKKENSCESPENRQKSGYRSNPKHVLTIIFVQL
jgi:hypothetical protein